MEKMSENKRTYMLYVCSRREDLEEARKAFPDEEDGNYKSQTIAVGQGLRGLRFGPQRPNLIVHEGVPTNPKGREWWDKVLVPAADKNARWVDLGIAMQRMASTMIQRDKDLALLIRTHADWMGEEWYFNGRLDDDDKRENALHFAARLIDTEPFTRVTVNRLYNVICRSLSVDPGNIMEVGA